MSLHRSERHYGLDMEYPPDKEYDRLIARVSRYDKDGWGLLWWAVGVVIAAGLIAAFWPALSK